MTVKQIDGGRARSSKEIALCLGDLPCPTCGNPMILKWINEDDRGAVARMFSRHCESDWDVVFTPGPGWDRRPHDQDPRYGATDDPSTIVKEPAFRSQFGMAIASLRRVKEPPPLDGDVSDVEIWDASLRADAICALGALLELALLGHGGDLPRFEPWLRAVIANPRAAWNQGAPS